MAKRRQSYKRRKKYPEKVNYPVSEIEAEETELVRERPKLPKNDQPEIPAPGTVIIDEVKES